jgi:ATP-binding cassette subfamily B (MDR/TAP) protein 1
MSALTSVKVDSKNIVPSPADDDQFRTPGFWAIVREIFPTIPYKPLLFLGLFTCIASGAMTPVFSFLLSRLLFEVSTGAHNVSTINFFGGVVLGIAALDGLLMGLKYFIMETAGNAWVLHIRAGVCQRPSSRQKMVRQGERGCEAPVFGGVMALQAALVVKCELRNNLKRAREEVAKGYYDVSYSFLLCFLFSFVMLMGFSVGHCEYPWYPGDGVRGV